MRKNLKKNKRRFFLSSFLSFFLLPFFFKKINSYELSDFEKKTGFKNYGSPSTFERVFRWILSNPALKGNGSSYSPLSKLEGTIFPNGLHFERHHYGVFDSNPKNYFIKVVDKNKIINVSLKELRSMEISSVKTFIECGGNSMSMYNKSPVRNNVDLIHGLISYSEWSGVKLKNLLSKYTYKKNEKKWIEFESYDKGNYNISIPYDQAYEKGFLALYQNGEAIRPEQGYPIRLIIPGWEGSTHVKWVSKIKLRNKPIYSRNETSKYTDLLINGKARQFSFKMETKSIILKPSPGLKVKLGKNIISGLAWSGTSTIKNVQVSFSSGLIWYDCKLNEEHIKSSFKRFVYEFDWNGEEIIVQSRCLDHNGYLQPSRKEFLKKMGSNAKYHFNAITSWKINKDGSVNHVY